MRHMVRSSQRYGEVTPTLPVTYRIVEAGLAKSPVAARQMVGRSFHRIVALAEVYGRCGRYDVIAALIRRIEQAAGPDQQLPLADIVEAESRADAEGVLALNALLPQLADPHPDTIKRVKRALAAEVLWAERALAAIEARYSCGS